MKETLAAIVTIGDELLIGQTIDTNSAWIARELNRIGIWVHRRVAIGDNREAILETLARESVTSDIVLITGGLGPTRDDITKNVLCAYFNARLVEDAGVLQRLKDMSTARGTGLVDAIRKQALVPDTCVVLENDRGTAPGMWFEKEGKVYISMPGVPDEMQGIMSRQVLKRLKGNFQLPVILHRTLITMGMGETQVATRLQDFEDSLPAHLRLAYLPGNGVLKLRLTIRGGAERRAADELEQLFSVMKETLADIVVVDDDLPIEAWIGILLKKSGRTIGTAESCTGGYIAHRITTVPGSSAYFRGSVVSYANEVKRDVLKVSAGLLETKGAVSEETVIAMLRGANRLLSTDLSVAVSGILGPDGGTPEKPVGTVWMAAGGGDHIKTRKYQLRYSRAKNLEISANYAMNLLREVILETE